MLELAAQAYVALSTDLSLEHITIHEQGIFNNNINADGKTVLRGTLIERPELRFAGIVACLLRNGDDPAELLRLGAFAAGGDPSSTVVSAEEHTAARTAVLACITHSHDIVRLECILESADPPRPDRGIHTMDREYRREEFRPTLDYGICADPRAFQSLRNRATLVKFARTRETISFAQRLKVLP